MTQKPRFGRSLTLPAENHGNFKIASGGARTHNLRLRRPTLYPVELRTRIARMVNLLLGGVKHSREPYVGRLIPRLLRSPSLWPTGLAKNENRP
jgi:hypothetical protein